METTINTNQITDKDFDCIDDRPFEPFSIKTSNGKRKFKRPPLPGAVILEMREEALNLPDEIDASKMPFGQLMDRYMILMHATLRKGPNGLNNTLKAQITEHSLKLEYLLISYLKSRTRTKLKEADTFHEQLKALWRRYYFLGGFGDGRNLQENRHSVECLKKWTHVALYLDAIGRKIARYHSAKPDTRKTILGFSAS